MKAISKAVLSFTVCSMALAACGSSKHSNNGSQQVRVQANAQTMDAEQLALAGEQLMAPHSFMLADKIFKMALAKDPSNVRATFYHHFIAPLMLAEGSAKRVTPLAQAAGRTTELNKGLAKIPMSAGRDFLLNGQADLNTADDAQALAAQYTQAVFDLYDYLKANQNLTLTLNMNPFVFRDEVTQRRDDNCVINESDDQQIDVVCDTSDILQTKINIADMIALRQYVASEALFAMMFSTYSISGAEVLLPTSNSISGQDAFNRLSGIPAFAKLRADNKLSRLRSLGSDFSVAWKWVVQNQSRLCPIADGNGIRRHGYLFERGICAGTADDQYSAQKNIATLDAMLKGATAVTFSNLNDARPITMNPLAVVDRPVQDLKSLNPYLDKCGNLLVRDKTLAGALPNGDADVLMKTTGCQQ